MNSAASAQLPKDRKHVVYQDLVALLTLASQATFSEDQRILIFHGFFNVRPPNDS